MSILSIGELLDLGNSASTAGLVPYSALEYNASGDISGISGSAIAGGVDSAVVSSIVSSYVESGVSGKADQSALEDCCSAMSAVVSAKLDASASGNFAPSGDYYSATNPSGFITTADITGKLDSTASSLFQPSGDYADASSLSSKLDASASGMFAPSGDYQSAGDYAFNSSLSSKLNASASSEFYPMTGNPSGFISGVDLTDYATTAYVDSSVSGKLDASASGMFAPSGDYQSAGDYAFNSSLSSKLDASASSQFAPSGDYVFNSSYSSFTGDVTNNISSISSIVSGITGDWSSKADASALDNKMDKSASSQFAPSGDYAYNSALSSYVNYSAISGEGGKVTSINGSGLSAYVSPIPTLPLYVESPLTASIDELSSQVTISITPDVYATVSSVSSLSAKQDKSAMTAYQSAGSYQTAGDYVSATTFSSYTASTNIVQIIANSADATGTDIIYVVTGEM